MIKHRVLVVDDNDAIFEDLKKILLPKESVVDLTATEALLFGESFPDDEPIPLNLSLDYAAQAEKALKMIKEAEEQNDPYDFMITDVIMPPGIDGVQLTKRVWEKHPEMEVVMVTAYSDYSWEDIVQELGESSRLVILKKPFDRLTMKQIVVMITEKKAAEMALTKHRDLLKDLVEQRTEDLVAANRDLARESAEHLRKKDLLESINRYYQTLFERNEVAIWHEDFSGVKSHLDKVRALGVTDLEAYLGEHPDELKAMAETVVLCEEDEATLHMFCVDSEQLRVRRRWLYEGNLFASFGKVLHAIWNGDQFCKFQLELGSDKEGRLYVIHSMAIPTEKEEFQRIPVSLRDITRQKQAEEVLKFQAFYDDLTRLPNKKFFRNHLDIALEDSRRQLYQKRKDALFALMFIDLDGFKDVNDENGHNYGDVLLQKVAERMKACIKRRSDTVARLGGDEFGIILNNINKPFQAEKIGRVVLEALREPFELVVPEHDIVVTASISCSIGIAMFPDDGMEPEILLEHADKAMYRAKRSGKNRLCFYTPSMNGEVSQRADLEHDLGDVIENHELLVYYQPIADLKTGQIVSVEALLRWLHPSQGLLSPAKFLTVAEDSGMMASIDMWVLDTVCEQLKQWQKILPEAPRVTVNLSTDRIFINGFCDFFEELIAAFGLKPDSFIIEVKESLFDYEPEQATLFLTRLKEMGAHLSLDDFGIGRSSLTELCGNPFDIVKLHHSISNGLQPSNMAAAIVNMAKGLGLKTTGEGAESQEQWRLLVDSGCDHAQGYYFSHPLSADDMLAFLNSYEPKAI